MMRYLSGWVRIIALMVYALQLFFLQLFIRLEPTMFGVNLPGSFLLVTDIVARYLPALAFASTFLLILYSLFSSSKVVKAISLAFLAMMVVEDFLPLGYVELIYGSVYWLALSVAILSAPVILLFITAIEKRSASVFAVAFSGLLASSFYIWSFLSRITFSLPPIDLLSASVYAFVIAFAALAVTMVKGHGSELYASLAISLAMIVPVTYMTVSNLLVQKIMNMVLQTSLGAPTPFPWFAPLFFLIFFTDIYALILSIRSRSFGPLSVAAGFTMIFTSVYLPYNALYSYIAFSGSLMVYLGLDQAKGLPDSS